MVDDGYQNGLQLFGMQLEKIRGAMNLRPLEFEIVTNIYRTDISELKNGLERLEYGAIIRLAFTLNVTLSEFIPRYCADGQQACAKMP